MPITSEVSFQKSILSYLFNYYLVPHRDDHEKQLNALKLTNNGRTKIIGSPHFPYDENTLLFEIDSEKDDGGIGDV